MILLTLKILRTKTLWIGKREDGWMWVNTSKGESSSSVHTLWKRHFNFVISEWNIRDTYMSDSQCSVAGCDMYSKVAEKKMER